MTIPRWGASLSVVLALAVLGGGCGDDAASGGDVPSGSSSSSESVPDGSGGSRTFLARAADEWEPIEAGLSATGSSPTEPSLAWFVSYVRPPADTPQQVRLSGHGTDLDGLDAELVGFSLEPVELGPARGLAGRSSDPIGPSVVLMPVTDDVTVMALSYELTTPELVTWSMELAPATEAEWRSANAAAFAASDE